METVPPKQIDDVAAAAVVDDVVVVVLMACRFTLKETWSKLTYLLSVIVFIRLMLSLLV